ncbi:MAG TPA: antitoxin VapB family protein [Candidatus Lokiarchaeia archaeon]|nr:antitoxin VapB family protein [Candidatus Lokiarchaeia archaeon]
MASKTICIKDEVYNKLVSLKGDEESFSELLNRMIEIIENEKNNHDDILTDVFGSGKDEIPDELLDTFSNIRDEIDSEFMDIQ